MNRIKLCPCHESKVSWCDDDIYVVCVCNLASCNQLSPSKLKNERYSRYTHIASSPKKEKKKTVVQCTWLRSIDLLLKLPSSHQMFLNETIIDLGKSIAFNPSCSSKWGALPTTSPSAALSTFLQTSGFGSWTDRSCPIHQQLKYVKFVFFFSLLVMQSITSKFQPIEADWFRPMPCWHSALHPSTLSWLVMFWCYCSWAD